MSSPPRSSIQARCRKSLLIACCIFLCLCGSTIESLQAEPPLSIKEARVPITGSDFNRPDPFPGRGEFQWPGNVAQLSDGELLMVHSAGYYHVSFAQPRLIEPKLRENWLAEGWPLDFPAPTGGRSMLVRSSNAGLTWGKPHTLVDLPLDDCPYGLLRCDDGTLLCFINVQASWYGYDSAPTPFDKDLDGLNTQQCVVRSIDDGLTWSEPIWLKSPGKFYERSHAQPILLSDGGILWPTYFYDGGKEKLKGAIHRSDDQGQTWRHISTVASEEVNVDEPAIAQLADSRFIMISRPDGACFYSDDAVTWTKQGTLVTEGIFKAPRLFVLQDGTIVTVCTYRNLQVFLGRNGGESWVGPLDLDPQSYGYPGGIKLADESLLITYGSSGRAPNTLYAVRFRVNSERDNIELLPINKK
ncbi:MAG: sialidase family protein [Planctomycetaceae bacterium]